MGLFKQLLAFCLALGVALSVAVAGPSGGPVNVKAAEPPTFKVSYGMGLPRNIALGPDGNLWFTSAFAARIGRAKPGGQVRMFVDKRLEPVQSIVAGPDGALWFTEGNAIGRITTSGEMSFFNGANISGSSEIVSGPDGALWFVDGAAIGRITLDGSVTTYPFPSGKFHGLCSTTPSNLDYSYPSITVGSDKAIWFTDPASDAIDRIDVSTGLITVYHLPLMNQPTNMTTGPDGNIWFFNCGSDQVGRLSFSGQPQSPVVTLFNHPAGETPGREVNTMISGPDGGIWLTRDTGIERFATDGTLTTFSGPNIGGPQGIVVGPDGALWFATHTASPSGSYPSINRMTTTGSASVVTVGNGIEGATSMTRGSDGAMWFANSYDNNIGRVDESRKIAYFSDPSIVQPSNLLLGPDGALWFLNSGTIGQIGRITPQGQVTTYLPPLNGQYQLPRPIGGMAFGPDGNLWLSAPTNGIYRMTPSGTLLPVFPVSVIGGAPSPLGSPGAITVGPDSAMWFVDGGLFCDPETQNCQGFQPIPPHVGRVTTTGSFTWYGVNSFFPNTLGSGGSIVLGPDGALWYHSEESPTTILRITTLGMVTAYTDPVNLTVQPGPLTVGPDGSIWLATNLNASPSQWFITRVTPNGVLQDYAMPTTLHIFNFNGLPAAPTLAFSGKGVMWFSADADIGHVRFSD